MLPKFAEFCLNFAKFWPNVAGIFAEFAEFRQISFKNAPRSQKSASRQPIFWYFDNNLIFWYFDDILILWPSAKPKWKYKKPAKYQSTEGSESIKILVDFDTLSGQTLQGSFSAASKPMIATKYALETSRRDLHNTRLRTALQSHFFGKNSPKNC